jgi:transcriptional regulator with XRE-family HTH domain
MDGIREIARKTGYTPGHISRIARGEKEPSLRCLQAIAEALGVSMEEALRSLRVDVQGDDRVSSG